MLNIMENRKILTALFSNTIEGRSILGGSFDILIRNKELKLTEGNRVSSSVISVCEYALLTSVILKKTFCGISLTFSCWKS